MRQIVERILRGWRMMVTSVFVVLVLTVPASKGILGKFLSVSATGGNNHGNNQANNHGNSHSHSDSHSNSGVSNSSPNSGPSASPMQPGNSCSSGRHSRSGHKGGGNRPNGH